MTLSPAKLDSELHDRNENGDELGCLMVKQERERRARRSHDLDTLKKSQASSEMANDFLSLNGLKNTDWRISSWSEKSIRLCWGSFSMDDPEPIAEFSYHSRCLKVDSPWDSNWRMEWGMKPFYAKAYGVNLVLVSDFSGFILKHFSLEDAWRP